MSWVVGVLAVAASAWAASTELFECSNECAEPRAGEDALVFCASIEYRTCPAHTKGGDPDWARQDGDARALYNQSLAIAGLTEAALAPECVERMRQVSCMVTFPACEISAELKSLCPDLVCNPSRFAEGCADAQTALCGVVSAADTFLDKSSCFSLDYTGAFRGVGVGAGEPCAPAHRRER